MLVNNRALPDSADGMKIRENPFFRALAMIALLVVAVRVTVEVVERTWPYVLTVLVLLTVAHIISWHRRRW